MPSVCSALLVSTIIFACAVSVCGKALRPPVSISASCLGKRYEVLVEHCDTFGDICSALCEQNKLIGDHQSVVYRGKPMLKTDFVLRSGVKQGDSVDIRPISSWSQSPLSPARKSKQVKLPKKVKEDVNKFKNNKRKDKADFDMKKLRGMFQNGFHGKDPFDGRKGKLSHPMGLDALNEMLSSNYFEDLLSSDSALESMRRMIMKNKKQYDQMLPGFAAQSNLITSSPESFKAAVKMAMLQLKVLKGSTTTDRDVTSPLVNTNKRNSSTTEKLVNQIKFHDDTEPTDN